MREEYGDAQAYRIGGEEFALLLPDDGEQEAYAAVERLHARLWQTNFPHAEPVTVSAGIASYPGSAGDRDQLLRVADGALYWAKNHGKNRSCVYSPTVVRIYTPDELAESAERHARLKAAEGLIRVVDAKDTYAGAHSQSVSRLVEGIARAMGLDEETVEQVRLAGLLHDLGKIAIPDRILQKPGKLDPDELSIMREHADLGYRLLEGLGVSPVDRWIRHHHEWWDGSGYPLGLAGEDIPLGSRIILVADAFDAMTSDRVYRAAGSSGEAIAELRRRCWTQFDARVVSALEKYLASLGEDPRADGATGLMFLLPTVPIGIVLGLLLGGRLGRLAYVRRAEAVAVLPGAGVADRGVPFAVRAVAGGRRGGHRAVDRLVRLPGGCGVRERHLFGMPIAGGRDAVNLAAILANGGHMPALPSAMRDGGPELSGVHNNSVRDASPNLAWFVDRWAAPAGCRWQHLLGGRRADRGGAPW